MEIYMTDNLEDLFRPHHHSFAHNVVPKLFYTNPINFMGALHFEGQPFLEHVWELTAQDQNLRGDKKLGSEGLKSIEFRDVPNNFLSNVIIMPQAIYQTEAIMICMISKVFLTPQKELESTASGVFILEYSEIYNNDGRPFLCMWDKSGSHLNFGRSDLLEPNEFVELCKAHFNDSLEANGVAQKPSDSKSKPETKIGFFRRLLNFKLWAP